jgi:type IV pilus assembly protein PilM
MPQLPSLNVKLGRRAARPLVGLDIQPGYVAAVQASVNGSLRVERAAGMALPGDAMREGEVLDEGTLAEALRELFAGAHLDKRVRVGVANQRTVLRMLELPPLTDRKELDAAVRFQAADQMPMPLENAVLDFHALGIVETPAGQRQRVAVVAAQRDMIERLLSAVRRAGLRPEAIDLSAFALIRALHRSHASADGPAPQAQLAHGPVSADSIEGAPARVLYLNVGGLTNMAIAEGSVCRFTRVVGGGLESISVAVAERQQMPLNEARELVASVDLTCAPTPVVQPEVAPLSDEGREQAMAAEPPEAEPPASEAPTEVLAQNDAVAADVRAVLENGVREIAGEVRNSIDFHRMQEGGGDVSSIVLSGPALAISGFAQTLSTELGVEVRAQTVGFVGEAAGHVAPEHLAVAAGLAIEEAPAR